jgi:hypothetical protein
LVVNAPQRKHARGTLIAAALFAGAALFVASCGTRAEGRAQPPDGAYANASVEGRTVSLIHVKDNGATVLVDTDGRLPRTWAEQFRRHGELPEGVYNIHKTHVEGHADFADVPVDRTGLWTIDRSGTISALPTGSPPPDGAYKNVMVEGRVVPMVHIKDNGATVLVDTEGQVPRTWSEQFRHHGDLPEGVYNIHKTHAEGHPDFHDLPVDRRGVWTIDAKGNLTAH